MVQWLYKIMSLLKEVYVGVIGREVRLCLKLIFKLVGEKDYIKINVLTELERGREGGRKTYILTVAECRLQGMRVFTTRLSQAFRRREQHQTKHLVTADAHLLSPQKPP